MVTCGLCSRRRKLLHDSLAVSAGALEMPIVIKGALKVLSLYLFIRSHILYPQGQSHILSATVAHCLLFATHLMVPELMVACVKLVYSMI